MIEEIIKWLSSTKLLSGPRKILERILRKAKIVTLFYNDPHRTKILDLIIAIQKENQMFVGNNEAYQIFMAAKNTNKIEGDIAEVGTYKGGSAKLICEAKGDKILHLFDTFEGLPQLSKIDIGFRKGEFSASLEGIMNYLKQYKNVNFYKGIFPETAEPVKNKRFSFVNLDVDLYESTLNCLKFFYPRMNAGGIIMSHDYINAKGVRKAFDGFFKDKPDPIIELSGSQCLIVKVSN